ncbi:2038_t:CDS:2 [Funneliformis caledonium]|uniref:2038_t:CDS:1 n=1 Tax=Funneliformis caledonium TaxID=1117310 RepID=A0A9N8V0K2_9GLOM|nr:2038_t:CDS:2 [Funneliformis caledonium]
MSLNSPSANSRRGTASQRLNPPSSSTRSNPFTQPPRQARRKSTPKKQTPLESPTNDTSGAVVAGSCRYDSSLGLLTKKFVNLLMGAKDGDLDLNTAATALEVQKRRIYDITNVLEGIGLIEKNSKNHVRWKGTQQQQPAIRQDYKRRIEELRAANENLESERQELERAEQEVDISIKNIYESEESSRLAFVYQSEIENLNSYRGGILIAVKSVSGMTPNIPEPIEDGQPNQPRYQVQIQHQNNQPVQICRLSDNPLNHHFPMTDNHFQFGNIPARVFPQPSPPLNVHDGGHLRFIALPPPFPSTPTPPDEDYEILDSNDIRSNRHHEIGSSDDMNEDFDPLGTPVNARDIFDVMRHSGREGFVDIFGREPNQRSREGGHRP